MNNRRDASETQEAAMFEVIFDILQQELKRRLGPCQVTRLRFESFINEKIIGIRTDAAAFTFELKSSNTWKAD